MPRVRGLISRLLLLQRRAVWVQRHRMQRRLAKRRCLS